MTHPDQTILALYAGQDLGWFRRRRTERHLARCRECRDEVQAFALARDHLVALNELPAISWNRLAIEMKANIRLGLAAGECVRGERTAGSRAWFGVFSGARTLAACASVMALVTAGLFLRAAYAPRAAGHRQRCSGLAGHGQRYRVESGRADFELAACALRRRDVFGGSARFHAGRLRGFRHRQRND